MEPNKPRFEPIVYPEYILTPSGYVLRDEAYEKVVSRDLQEIEAGLMGYDEASAGLARVARLWGKQGRPIPDQLIER